MNLDTFPISLAIMEDCPDQQLFNHQFVPEAKEHFILDGKHIYLYISRILSIINLCRPDSISKQAIRSTTSYFGLFMYLASKAGRNQVCSDGAGGTNFRQST